MQLSQPHSLKHFRQPAAVLPEWISQPPRDSIPMGGRRRIRSPMSLFSRHTLLDVYGRSKQETVQHNGQHNSRHIHPIHPYISNIPTPIYPI